MADYNISAEITADASGYEAGIKKAQKASKNLSSTISGVIKGLGKNGLVGALGSVGLASTGLSATLGTVVKVAKQVSKAINECTEAYKTQLVAERSLDTAIQNNPFVTGASADALKQFASEMQKVSNYGDEELIPMMTNLISLGRTETETMQIMSVAMDMSAGMGISLDTAITQLNATLNGNIGRLGQQNAELKGLTEEELKQGKAVEILGEKFKGLSSATADTSKQLKNIKGDFKEALGQFTLPSSDMWNKFWAGFYERGIEIINKINAYLDAQTIGKKVSGLLVEQLKPLEYYGDRIKYLRDAMHAISDDELEALGNYLSSLSYITDDQKQILNFVEQEKDRRKDLAEIEKKNAEAKAEKVKQQEKENAELEKQKEKEKELAEIRAKELKLENEWADKLFAIRLENLEATRDKELENEKLTQEEREAIVDFYGEQILAMKIKQLEKERDEALKQENLTEEAKRSINLYYENRITNAKKDEEEKRLKLKKKEIKEEKKEEKSKYEVMLEYAKQYARQIASVFKNIVSNVKNIFSKAGNIFMKIIEFNPDEALDNLLKFEDAILTFFVETLPKLPAFFKSAMQSIIVLIDTVLNVLDFDVITEILSNILQTIITAVSNWVGSGGWKKLLDAFLKLQQMIENVIADNLPAIVDTIVAMLPDLIDMLIASIVSASQTLAKLIKPILKLIVKLIEAIIEVAFSDEVLDSSVEVIESFIESIIDILIKDLPKMLPRLIAKVIKFILSSIPKATVAIVKGTVKAFSTTNWGQVIWDCFQGFIDAFKELFGIHSPSTVFEGFGKNMIEGLWNGIKETGTWLINNIKSFFSGISDNIGGTIGNIFNGVSNVFSNIWNNLVNGASWAVDGIKNAFNGITAAFSNIWNNVVYGANQAVEGIKNVFNGIAGSVNSAFGNIGNSIKSAINGVIDNVNVAINSINSVVGWTGIRLATIQKLANGTDNARRGLTLVGEAGPELVYFNGGEQVLNNKNTNKALAEMGSGKNITNNITFNNTKDTTAFAVMSQLRQYNRQLAINGIL